MSDQLPQGVDAILENDACLSSSSFVVTRAMATEERNLNNEAKSISKADRHHCHETKNDEKEFEQDLNLDSLFNEKSSVMTDPSQQMIISTLDRHEIIKLQRSSHLFDLVSDEATDTVEYFIENGVLIRKWRDRRAIADCVDPCVQVVVPRLLRYNLLEYAIAFQPQVI